MKKTIILLTAFVLTSCSANKYASTENSAPNTYLPDYIAAQVREGKITDQPLVVIDELHIQYDGNHKANLNVRADDVYSIESIEKDNAKAIEDYGEKAKGGVILITTKEGKKLADKPASEQKILVLEGKRKLSKKQLAKISPNDIETITVIKSREDVKKYTKKAYDGVIIIKMKEGKKIR
jgi:hypothetical protein